MIIEYNCHKVGMYKRTYMMYEIRSRHSGAWRFTCRNVALPETLNEPEGLTALVSSAMKGPGGGFQIVSSDFG